MRGLSEVLQCCADLGRHARAACMWSRRSRHELPILHCQSCLLYEQISHGKRLGVGDYTPPYHMSLESVQSSSMQRTIQVAIKFCWCFITAILSSPAHIEGFLRKQRGVCRGSARDASTWPGIRWSNARADAQGRLPAPLPA